MGKILTPSPLLILYSLPIVNFAFADLEFTPQREAVRQVHRGLVKISIPKLAISGKLSVPSPLPDKKG
jgi:hypothetical protein